MGIIHTAERVYSNDLSTNYVYQRCLFPYNQCVGMVSGRVLELGTGDGYGVKTIAPRAEKFVTLDKRRPDIDVSKFPNVEFIQTTVPPLKNIADGTFDYVISFQVIEHIQNDDYFIKEIQRVLKKGGKAIITTPNKKMSLTRNPWHIREYTIQELEALLLKHFPSVKKMGVYGNDKVMKYYEENKKSVEKFTKYDVLNLQYKLPRQLLQIPYDILNAWNRNKLLKSNNSLTTGISLDDFYLQEPDDSCLDLFYVATN